MAPYTFIPQGISGNNFGCNLGFLHLRMQYAVHLDREDVSKSLGVWD